MPRRTAIAPDDTRARLTGAATQLFAAKGFHAVSVREIARSAGVGPSLISYHFGDKRGLHDAVVDGYYARLAEIADQLAPQLPMPWPALMTRLWREVWARREAIRLISWSVVAQGRVDTTPTAHKLDDDLAAFAAHLASLTGKPTQQVRQGAVSMVYLISRYALNEPDELMRVTRTRTLDAAHDAVTTHLTELAMALFGQAPV